MGLITWPDNQKRIASQSKLTDSKGGVAIVVLVHSNKYIFLSGAKKK